MLSIRSRRGQRGQAIVVIALMMVVLLGFVALAIDSARAYNGRRTLQDAVDAAALYAADSYKSGSTWSVSQTAGAALFATDLRNYATPSCPSFTTPTAGGVPVVTNCTLAGSITLTIIAADLGPGGQTFKYAAQQPLTAALIQVVGQSPDITLAASATATALDQAQQPALVSLSTAGCYSVSGTSMSIIGSKPVSVYGDVVSNGALSIDASSSLAAAGDVRTRCAAAGPTAPTNGCWQTPTGGTFPPSVYTAVSAVGSCTAPQVLGKEGLGFRRADPGYSAPTIAGLASVATPGFGVSISSGLYTSDPAFGNSGFFNNTCYFLRPGVYDFSAGVTFNNGMVSNVLRPPTVTDSFWTGGGATCQGDFSLNTSATAPALANGVWAIWLTSTRTDVISGVNYVRESAPSACKTVNLSSESMHIIVSNVPGAQGYNVYGKKSNCSQPASSYGYLGSMNNLVTESNLFTSSCPDTSATPSGFCNLGQSTYNLFGSNGCIAVVPSAALPVDTCGALMPDPLGAAYAGGLPKQNPGRATVARPVSSGGGDLANYNLCAASSLRATCPGTLTPGAVTMYVPGTNCFSLTATADARIFSGAQYNWVVLNEPATNTCAGNLLQGFSNSALIGAVYTPGAAMAITGANAFQSPDFGGLVADTVVITSAAKLSLGLNPNVAPAKPGVRLSG